MRFRLLLFAFLMFLSATDDAYGWGTNIERPYNGWLSIYNAIGQNQENELESKDEHVAMSDWALRALGVDQYSYNSNPISIIDLNASLFRNDELGKIGSYLKGKLYKPDEYEMEVRQLPAPSHFSGIPDYSYTLYDWINKNYYCPPHAGLKNCHVYKGWMGALNSNHFGTQAKNSYWHLHHLALNLANHAKDLRNIFSKDKTAIDAYREYVREAEHEALSVEGYAQHFLQDRWSTGHMWERWDAPDYDQLPIKKLGDNFYVAMFAGLLHGSEDVTHTADALSSPDVALKERAVTYSRKLQQYLDPIKDIRHAIEVASEKKGENHLALQTKNGLFVPRWKHGKNSSPDFLGYDGIGDDRFADMLDGKFGKEFSLIGKDYPINVNMQKMQMKQCFEAGWAEVIRAFGPNIKGGFGIGGATLLGNIKKFSSLGFQCDDQWATNISMYVGWSDSFRQVSQTFGQLARIVDKYQTKSSVVHTYRKALIDIGLRLYAEGKGFKKLKNGTSLARGEIGDFGVFKTGNKYPKVASFTEPEDINKLPDDDERGKDKKAWFGFFNRSHADYWCGEKGADALKKMRGSDDVRTQRTCEYLANRFYEGTDPHYKGNYQEKRTLNHTESGQPLHSVCHYFGGRKLWNPNTPNEIPFYLSGGYVGDSYARTDHDSDLDGYDTVANWCAKVPVLNYLREKNGDMKDETVAKVKSLDDPITLRGEDLGMHKGKLWIDCGSSGSIRVPDDKIQNWHDSKIKFDLSWLQEEKRKETTHSICVGRADGMKSVGHFLIRAETTEQKPPTANFNNPVLGCWKNGSMFSWSDTEQHLNSRYSFKIIPAEGRFLRAVMRPLGGKEPSVHWNGYFDPDSGIVDFYLVDPENFILLAKNLFPGVDEDQLNKVRVEYGYDFILRLKFKPSDTVIGTDDQLFGIAKRFYPDVGRNSDTGRVEISYGGTYNLGNNVSWGGSLFNLWTRIPPTQISKLDIIGTDKGVPIDVVHENQTVRLRAFVRDSCPLGGDEIIVKVFSSQVLFTPFYITLHRDKSLGVSGDQEAIYLSKPVKIDQVNHKVATDFEGQEHLISLGYRANNKKGLNLKQIRFIIKENNPEDFSKDVLRSASDARTYFQHEMSDAGQQLIGLNSSDELGLGGVHPSRFLRVIDKLYPSFVAGWEPDITFVSQLIKMTEANLEECMKTAVRSPNQCEPYRKKLAEQRDTRSRLIKARKEISRQFKRLPDDSTRLAVHPDSLASPERWKVKFNDDIAMAEGFIQQLEQLRDYQGMNVNMDRLQRLRSDMIFITGLQLREVNGEQTANISPLPAAISVTPEVNPPPSRSASTPQKTRPETEEKRQQDKPIKWTAYKLLVKTHGNRLPTMDVLKLSFQKGAKRAAFRVMRYPVSMARNDQTGKIIWSINWSAGDVVENEMAVIKDMINSLEIIANNKKKGGVEKSAIAGMINQRLGADAQQKK